MTLHDPTHAAIDFDVLWPLAEALDALPEPRRADDVDAVAERAGVPRAHAWVALGMQPMVQLQREHPIAIGVCCGRCQLWGAAERIEALLTLRRARIAAGQLAFDLVPRGCLSRCERAPVATAVMADGLVQLDGCDVEQVRTLLERIATDGVGDDGR